MLMNQILVVETAYFLVILLSSLLIFFRTRSLFRFSGHTGIRYYSYAFLSLALGFTIRYVVMLVKLLGGSTSTIQEFTLLTLAMEFFLLLPGFFLLYSMTWHVFEERGKLFVEAALFLLPFLFAVADYLLQGFYFLYGSQVILFLLLSIVALRKYRAKRNNFLQLYFISMLLFLFVWCFNLLAQYTIDLFPMMRIYTYLFTLAACLIMLYITLRLTRDAP